MEEKRGAKREHFPSAKGNSSSSGARTPPLASSGSPPPPQSPTEEVSLYYNSSPVFEQGGSSKNAPVVNLASSSDEEGLIPNISHDFDFAQRLFRELNRDLLAPPPPPGDGKVIILSNSDGEEEDVREEKTTSTEDGVASAAVYPASTAFTDDVDAPVGAKGNNSDDQGPARRVAVGTATEMTPTSLRPSEDQDAKAGMLQGLLR
jgi:hypothetical protein